MPVVAPVPGQFSRASRGMGLGPRLRGHGSGGHGPGPRAGGPASVTLDRCDCAEYLPGTGEPHSRPPVSGIGAGTVPGRYIITPAEEAPRSGYAVTHGDPGVIPARRGQ